ncbi:hypothetical protein EDD11_009424 [Mortierella claussenii]|nr:hypothetical protein EDD11_009424 [Mortierella claussenii]
MSPVQVIRGMTAPERALDSQDYYGRGQPSRAGPEHAHAHGQWHRADAHAPHQFSQYTTDSLMGGAGQGRRKRKISSKKQGHSSQASLQTHVSDQYTTPRPQRPTVTVTSFSESCVNGTAMVDTVDNGPDFKSHSVDGDMDGHHIRQAAAGRDENHDEWRYPYPHQHYHHQHQDRQPSKSDRQATARPDHATNKKSTSVIDGDRHTTGGGYREQESHRAGSAVFSKAEGSYRQDLDDGRGGQEIVANGYSHITNDASINANINENSKKGEKSLTVRDLVDSKKLRDEILRRSQNSSMGSEGNRHHHRQREQHEERLSISQSKVGHDSAMAGRKFSNDTQQQTRAVGIMSNDARRDNDAEGQTSEEPPLERRYRIKQDPLNEIHFQRTDTAKRSASSTHPKGQNGITVAAPDGGDRNSLPTPAADRNNRRQRNQSPSSYSPSDFSQSQDNESSSDEDQEQDQDTVELKRTIDPEGPCVPAGTHSSLIPTASPPLSRPQSHSHFPAVGHGGGDIKATPSNPPHSHAASISKAKDNVAEDDLGYGSEFSFEREVAIAKANREKGKTFDRQCGTGMSGAVEYVNHGAGSSTAIPGSSLSHSSNGRILPITRSSRLEHGRGLVIEDLMPSTKRDSGARQQQEQLQQQPHYQMFTQQHQQWLPHIEQSAQRGNAATTNKEQHWRPAAGLSQPLPTKDNLAQLGIIVSPDDDRFMELAGSVGKGQAVSSVLGTLKAMIRELKKENRTLQKTLRKEGKLLRSTPSSAIVTTATAARSRHGKEYVVVVDNLSNVAAKAERTVKQGDKKSGVQREKGEVVRNLEIKQRPSDELKQQRHQMQLQKRKRAEEEADLLYFMSSGSDDEEGDSVSKSDTETESESKSESHGGDKYDGRGVDDIEDMKRTPATSVQRKPSYESNSYSRAHPTHVLRKSADFRWPSLAKFSSGSSSRRRSGRKHQSSKDRQFDASSSPELSRSKSRLFSKHLNTRSKSASPEMRRIVEKVEKVHIHHHIYCREGKEGRGSQVVSTHSRSEPIQETQQEEGIEGDLGEGVHRLQVGSGFRLHRHRFDTQERLDIPPSSLRSALSRSLPEQRQQNARYLSGGQHQLKDPRTRAVYGFEVHKRASPANLGHDEDGLYSPIQTGAQTTGSTLRMSLPAQDVIRSGERRAQHLTAVFKNMSLADLQRILSLRKPHDANRCTVCCKGGDGDDHTSLSQEQFAHDDAQYERQHRRFPTRRSSPSRRPQLPKRLEDWRGKGRRKPGTMPDGAPTPEQELHFALDQLDGELQHLRRLQRSYFEVSRDLEALEQFHGAAGADSIDEEGSSTSSGHHKKGSKEAASSLSSAASGHIPKTGNPPESLKELKKQLLEVADSLIDKADSLVAEVDVLKRQQKQQDEGRGLNKGSKSMSGKKHRSKIGPSRGDDSDTGNSRHPGSGKHVSLVKARRQYDHCVQETKEDTEEEREKHGQDTEKSTSWQWEDEIQDPDSHNDTQDSTRPSPRRKNQQLSPMRQGHAPEDDQENSVQEEEVQSDEN